MEHPSSQLIDVYLDRLGEISIALQSEYHQVAQLESRHTRDRLTAYSNAPQSTVKERELASDFQVLDLTDDIRERNATIRALSEERDHLRLLLTYTVIKRG